MGFCFFIWDDEPGGNVEHVAEHGLMPEEAEWVVLNPLVEETGKARGRSVRKGYLPDGRWVKVVFEWVDADTVYVVTGYERTK